MSYDTQNSVQDHAFMCLYEMRQLDAYGPYVQRPPVVMADDNAHAAADSDLCGSLKVGGAVDCVASNGEDVSEGKVVVIEQFE